MDGKIYTQKNPQASIKTTKLITKLAKVTGFEINCKSQLYFCIVAINNWKWNF